MDRQLLNTYNTGICADDPVHVSAILTRDVALPDHDGERQNALNHGRVKLGHRARAEAKRT